MRNKKIFRFGYFLILVAAFTLLFSDLQIIIPIFIAGVITQGILGGFRNKVGPVVGGKWKTIDWMRSYVIPSNPNTAGQQVQRSRMKQAVSVGRQLLGALLKPFWDKFYSDMSGFNAWISDNIMLLTATDYFLTTSAVMSKGTVLGVANLASTYAPADGQTDFSFDDNANGSTGLQSDFAYLVVAHKDGTVYLTKATAETRGDGASLEFIPSGLTAADLRCYLFFYRGTGSELEVSDSSGVTPSAV